MKKTFISCIVSFLILASCKENLDKKIILTPTIAKDIDSLFSRKNEITDINQLNFIKEFYVLAIVDSTLKKDNSINEKALVKTLNAIIVDSLDGFNCTEISNKKLDEVLKKSKTKEELINSIHNSDYNSLMTDGLINYDIEGLTDTVIRIFTRCSSSMGGSDLLYNYKNGEYHLISEKELSELSNPFLNKFEKKMGKKFKRQNGKYQTYDKTVINNVKYFTIPFYEEIAGDDCSGCADRYNLLIATNLKNNEYYYIYDDPVNNNDDWKLDAENSEQGATTVTELNPQWTKIK